MASVTLRPAGAGNLTNLTPNPAVSNYLNVDESSQDGDTTYNYCPSGAVTDLYTIDSNSIGAGDTINSVTVYAYVKHDAASHSGGARRLAIRENSTTTYDGTVVTTTSYVLVSKTWTTRPSGGSFTKSDIDSLQIGLELSNTGSFQTSVKVTQIYVVVDYTASGGGSPSTDAILFGTS